MTTSCDTNSTYRYAYNPWDYYYEFDVTDTATRTVHVVAAALMYPSIVIYLAIMFAVCSKPPLRRHGVYLLLVVQNTYDLLFLIFLTPANLEAVSTILLPEFSQPTAISCAVGNLCDLLWFEHILAHLMVAGNRFVVVSYYPQCKRWFTPRNTVVYIVPFCFIPVVRLIIFLLVLQKQQCMLNLAGVAVISPSQEASSISDSIDLVIVLTCMSLAVVFNAITIYRLRLLRNAVVSQTQPLGTQMHTISDNGETNRVIHIESSIQGLSPQLQYVTVASNQLQVTPKLNKEEVRLTVHFLVVTGVFIALFVVGKLSYLVVIPHVLHILKLLATLNLCVNALSTVLLSKDIRRNIFCCNA